jgi:hypothetical protein
MPETEGDVIAKLREIVALGVRTAIIEDVSKGVMPGRAHAMIVLNVNAAIIRTALACWGVRVVLVRPQEWQKHFGLGKRRDCASDTEWKNKLKAEAQRRFPNCDVTLKTADSLLLMDYGRLTIKEAEEMVELCRK